MTAVFISFTLGLLGFAYLMLGETEVRSVQRHVDRERCRQAAWDVASLAASWWSAGGLDSTSLPDSSEWKGSYQSWREEGRAHPFWDGLPPERLEGEDDSPDLLLEDGPFLASLSALLGDHLVVERIAVSAPARADGHRLGRATLTCTVATRRGGTFGGRSRLVARIEAMPAFQGPEVLAAGGDIHWSRGAHVRWGLVRADGDIAVPGPGEPGHPVSGLPRNSTGFDPLHFAPGGPIDWDLTTHFRESVLTELMGYTRGGERVPDGLASPPRLADPWLAVHAGGALEVGSSGRPAAGASRRRQPHPHDPRNGDLSADASHLMHRLGEGADPLLTGRLDSLAAARTGPSGGQRRQFRRFILAGKAAGGEGLWREGGSGPARPAADWLADSVSRPLLAVFTAGGGEPAERVTLNEGAGQVLVEARRLVLTATGGGRMEGVNMPGEPFLDTGIDTDGDGRVEPETAGNGRWDCDCDGDGVPDAEPPREHFFEHVHSDVSNGRLPDGDEDPARLAFAPHEAFLNFAWPESARDLSVRVAFGELEGDAPRPVEDLDRDGLWNPAFDLFTSKAHDAVGARVELPLHFRGLLVNLSGSIELGPGYQVYGALRAAEDIELRAGATVSFDAALSTRGRPSGMNLPSAFLGDHAWTRGASPLPSSERLLPPRTPPTPSAALGRAGPGTSRGNRG